MKLPASLRKFVQAVTGKRHFESAGGGSRWPMTVSMANPARQALAARAVTASRSSWLIANAPIAEAIVAGWGTHLVGDGPSARSLHPNQGMARALEGSWLGSFYNHASVDGQDLGSVLTAAARALVGQGEAFYRMVTTDRGVRLQELHPDQIDPSLNRETDGGGRIIAGIEFDAAGPRVRYWVRPSPDTVIGASAAIPVDAADILHLYEQKWPGQVRGLSWLAPVATTIVEYDAALDAALTKLKTTALLCAFIKDLDGQSTAAEDLAAEQPMEPGASVRLPPGLDVVFPPISDMSSAEGFLKRMVQTIASGVGLPYEVLSSDYSQTNYSSSRLALQSFLRRCKAIRAGVLVAKMLRPFYERHVTVEILTGRINAPDFARNPQAFFDASWLWPAHASINPLDEAKATILLMQAGITSRQAAIAETGRDPETVDAEIDSDTHADMASNVTPIKNEAA